MEQLKKDNSGTRGGCLGSLARFCNVSACSSARRCWHTLASLETRGGALSHHFPPHHN